VHASSLTMNWRYERRLTAQDDWTSTALEWLCWARATWMLAIVFAGFSDWTRLPLLYSLGLGVLLLNQARQLADHHFDSEGEPLDMDAHILDSCNFTGPCWMTWLLFPFSIRYHALHHLEPTLPYHNLAAAHAHLSTNLPSDSPYHRLEQPDWWTVAGKTLIIGRSANAEPLAQEPITPSSAV
jgi:fatty acid desaturase